MLKIAIYSRKSKLSETGDSIENQIELCKKYALQNYNDELEFVIYEDEGFSGGNTNRPQFQRLLSDTKAKKYNVLICYRLDRISRNVADFSSTLELLQSNNIAFVSIKERFDTGTPMGRTMVYIASVFAQLERETIAERVRDNMFMLARSGRYMGGQIPLGFTTEKTQYIADDGQTKTISKLIPYDEELKTVKTLYEILLSKGSIYAVQKYCIQNNIRGKNGGQLVKKTIAEIIKNPVYCISDEEVYKYYKSKGIKTIGVPNGNGIIHYGKFDSSGNPYEPEKQLVTLSFHRGIISSKDWLRAQNIMQENISKKFKRTGTSKTALLGGIIKCAYCGKGFGIQYGRKRDDGKNACVNKNVNCEEIEKIVIDSIMSATKEDIHAAFYKKYNSIPDEFKHNKKESIEKELASKKRTMDNFLNQLGNANETAMPFIMNKINILSKEIDELNYKLNEYGCSELEHELETRKLHELISNVTEFKKAFDYLDHDAQKLMLRRIIERIDYDGINKTVDIFYKI